MILVQSRWCGLGKRIHRAVWTIVGVRMLFADQLGPHFTDDVPADEPVLLVESRGAFARRRVHRQKTHEQGTTVLLARGFTMAENDFQEWLGTRRPAPEDF